MKNLFYFPTIILIYFLFSSIVIANTPWSPSVKVSSTTGNETTVAAFYPYVYVSYNSSPQKFVVSTNGGLTWGSEYGIPTSYCDGSMYTDELGDIHLSLLYSGPVRVCYVRSTDNGTTWTAPVTLNTGSPSGIDKNWTFVIKNRIYVGWVAYNIGTGEWDMRLAKSNDRGLTFSTQVTVNDGNNITYRQWAVPREDPKDSNIVYFCMMWDRRNFGVGYSPPWQVFVAKSTNGGASFLPNVALPDTGITPQLIGNTPYSITSSMAVSPLYNDVYVAWVDLYSGAGGKLNVFFSRSTNGGTSFSNRVKIPDGPNPDDAYHFQPWIECDRFGTIHMTWYDTRGYAANSSGGTKGLYYTYSTDRGSTWAPNQRVSDTVDAFYGFIGHYETFTTDSLRIYSTWTELHGSPQVYYSWRYLPTLVNVPNKNTDVVRAFKLSQNYPNPFNPTTTINYELPKTGTVILKVFDELGKDVKTLVNGTQNEGKYDVTWDASDFSSGIYFYRLTAGDFSETKRMILIK